MADGQYARTTPDNDDAPPGLLTRKQAMELIGLKRWTFEQFEANDPSFPKRINQSFSRVRWFRRTDLLRWLDGDA